MLAFANDKSENHKAVADVTVTAAIFDSQFYGCASWQYNMKNNCQRLVGISTSVTGEELK